MTCSKLTELETLRAELAELKQRESLAKGLLFAMTETVNMMVIEFELEPDEIMLKVIRESDGEEAQSMTLSSLITRARSLTIGQEKGHVLQ